MQLSDIAIKTIEAIKGIWNGPLTVEEAEMAVVQELMNLEDELNVDLRDCYGVRTEEELEEALDDAFNVEPAQNEAEKSVQDLCDLVEDFTDPWKAKKLLEKVVREGITLTDAQYFELRFALNETMETDMECFRTDSGWKIINASAWPKGSVYASGIKGVR